MVRVVSSRFGRKKVRKRLDSYRYVIGTRSVEKEVLAKYLRPEQLVIDLVNLERDRRLEGLAPYEGICW